MWLWTGSKTTKRVAEPRWPSTVRCGRRTERKRSGKTRRPWERVISHFSAVECTERGRQSRLCASLRPLRGAKNAVLTNLPLRSCVASSYRKNVRNKWGRGSHLGVDTIAAIVIAMVLTVSVFFKLSSELIPWRSHAGCGFNLSTVCLLCFALTLTFGRELFLTSDRCLPSLPEPVLSARFFLFKGEDPAPILLHAHDRPTAFGSLVEATVEFAYA